MIRFKLNVEYKSNNEKKPPEKKLFLKLAASLITLSAALINLYILLA